jgi:hypothetical protein
MRLISLLLFSGVAFAQTTVINGSGSGTAAAAPQFVTATVNQTGCVVELDFTEVSGVVPTIILSDNVGGSSCTPVIPTFANLPDATPSAPVELHLLTDFYQTTGITWPDSSTNPGQPTVWCGGQDALVACNWNGSQNWWSYQAPARSGNGSGTHAFFPFTLLWDGSDLYMGSQAGLFQSVVSAHVNMNSLTLATTPSYTAGSAQMLFGSVWTFGQGSFNNFQSGSIDQVAIGSPITAASSISPTTRLFHVTGTTQINTLVVPSSGGCSAGEGNGCQISVIPDAAFTYGTSGNIAASGTAVIGKLLTFTLDNSTAKWYPSY